MLYIYMTIQGTSAKIHFIPIVPIVVYLAILMIHIKKSVKFWARGGGVQALYEKKHSMTDSAGGAGGSRRISQSLIFCDIDFFGRHP